jgi:WD40 repeat protein
MELVNDGQNGSGNAKRSRDENEDAISSSSSVASLSSPVNRNTKNRRTQQVICTGTAPGILTTASGTFMMTQDRDNVFRLFDAVSQEVLWMCDSHKELELKAYCPVSNKIVAYMSVPKTERAKACQLAVWDLNTGKVLLLPAAADRRHQALLCINRVGTRIIVTEQLNPAMMDLEARSELLRFQLSSGCVVVACCFTRDGSKVAVVSSLPSVTNFAFDVWEGAPTLGLPIFSRNVKSPELIRLPTSSFNSQMIAVVAGGKIVVMDLSADSHLLLPMTAVFWYSICFGCDDNCIVALRSGGGTEALGVYRISDSVTLFRVPLKFNGADIGRKLFATSSKIYLAVGEGGTHSIVCVFDYATGAKLQQSSVYKYPRAQLYVPEPEMILM